jgi:hypothetical protein
MQLHVLVWEQHSILEEVDPAPEDRAAILEGEVVGQLGMRVMEILALAVLRRMDHYHATLREVEEWDYTGMAILQDQGALTQDKEVVEGVVGHVMGEVIMGEVAGAETIAMGYLDQVGSLLYV